MKQDYKVLSSLFILFSYVYTEIVYSEATLQYKSQIVENIQCTGINWSLKMTFDPTLPIVCQAVKRNLSIIPFNKLYFRKVKRMKVKTANQRRKKPKKSKGYLLQGQEKRRKLVSIELISRDNQPFIYLFTYDIACSLK